MTEHSADHDVSTTATAGLTDAAPIAQHDDQQLAAGEYLAPTVHTTRELRVTDGGTWLVRSTSQTVCHLDLDRMLLLRARGTGSPPLPYDDEWVPLARITSITTGDTGVVRVGDRHEYLTDPGAWSADYRWWIPRTCTAIERTPEPAAEPCRDREPLGDREPGATAPVTETGTVTP